jgi:hypothetical protein
LKFRINATKVAILEEGKLVLSRTFCVIWAMAFCLSRVGPLLCDYVVFALSKRDRRERFGCCCVFSTSFCSSLFGYKWSCQFWKKVISIDENTYEWNCVILNECLRTITWRNVLLKHCMKIDKHMYYKCMHQHWWSTMVIGNMQSMFVYLKLV